MTTKKQYIKECVGEFKSSFNPSSVKYFYDGDEHYIVHGQLNYIRDNVGYNNYLDFCEKYHKEFTEKYKKEYLFIGRYENITLSETLKEIRFDGK
jgi:hypothetical protein